MRQILLAAACLVATAMPALSQTLHVSLRQDFDNLDPTLTTSYIARIVLAGLCDKLFDNPTVDKLLELGRDTTDAAKRRAAYQQVWQALRADLPITYLYSPRNIVAMTAKLQGFRAVPDGMIRVQGLEMSRQ